ncbi:MAG: polysaccharide deacetylase family protein [Planctomycetales bacterium]|nr:polysaccharide deacetylase family protein [Planctomycetales bacterium]
MSLIHQTLKTILATVLPSRRFVVRGKSSRPVIHLTFDDGPHPEHTPRLLDALQEHNVRATFFVVGIHAASHPDLVRRIVAEGHAIGNHSYFHREPSQTSADSLLVEVRECRSLLYKLTGRDVNLFRPPKGSLSVSKLRGLWNANQTVVLWNTDPRDFAMTDSNQLVRWAETYRPNAGDILLMHDNHPHAAEAVGALVRRAAEFGLRCEPLAGSDGHRGSWIVDRESSAEVPA